MNPLDGLHYFTEQGEPNISYKFELCNDGYGYLYFCNEGLRSTLHAKVIIESMQGLELVLPYYGRTPQVVVLPQERKIIAFRVVEDEQDEQTEPRLDFKVVACFKKDCEDLIKATLDNGMRFVREFRGCDVGICFFILYHNEGIVFYYENKSEYYRLTERMVLNLVNCTIEGQLDNENICDFVLNPGKTHFINIIKDIDSEAFTANIQTCNFEVEQQNQQKW